MSFRITNILSINSSLQAPKLLLLNSARVSQVDDLGGGQYRITYIQSIAKNLANTIFITDDDHFFTTANEASSDSARALISKSKIRNVDFDQDSNIRVEDIVSAQEVGGVSILSVQTGVSNPIIWTTNITLVALETLLNDAIPAMGGIAIGDPVGGSTPLQVLFVDANGNLAQDSELVFNPSTNTLSTSNVISGAIQTANIVDLNGVNLLITFHAAFGVTLQVAFSLRQGAQIASASNIIFPGGSLGANSFEITGTTTIEGIFNNAWPDGFSVVLFFAGALTLTHDFAVSPTEHAMLLNGSVNASMTAGSSITLRMATAFGARYWVETARMIA